MIIAETYMHSMPEFCGECDFCNLTPYDRGKCLITGLMVDMTERAKLCKLHDIPDDALDGPDWHREK